MLTQILLNSIISALLLSLVAIGFNLVFNTTRVFHLAHGAMFVTAVYGVGQLNGVFEKVFSTGPAFVVSLLLSLLICAALMIATEYLIYRPLYLKGANPAISLISSLGVYLLITSFLALVFGNQSISLSSSSAIVFSTDYFKLTNTELYQLIISSALLFAVLIVSKTKIYIQIRAVSDSYVVAEKFGIDLRKTRLVALILGTLLAGIAGIMKASDVAIDPYSGLAVTLAASVAVIVGGLRSLLGTLIACFVIALIENFSVLFLTAQWKDLLTYGLLVFVLVFYQQGLVSVKQRVEAQ